MKLEILYEDNHLIAVYKPNGVLVQGDKTGDTPLMDEVKSFIKNRDKKPGNVFLGLIHRLDRPVSGVVLFAKTSKGASRLSEQFRNHSIQKIYHALLNGEIKKTSGTLVHYIKKDHQNNKVTVFSKPAPGSLRAELDYEVLDKKLISIFFPNIKDTKDKSLVKIKLKTGRPHQIRSQFSFIGHPLVGDTKYGSAKILPDKSLALVASSLKFKKATGDEEVFIDLFSKK